MLPDAGIPGDPAGELARHLGAHLLDRLPDRGQTRVGVLGRRRVVEADHGHVVRDAPAGAAQGADGAQRHQIRGGEDRVQIRLALQQPRHGVLARALAEVAVDDRAGGVRLGDGVAVAVAPVHADRHVRRTGDRGDHAAAGAEQVADRLPRAAAVVGVHVREVGGEHRPAGQDRGHTQDRQRQAERVPAVRADQQDAVGQPAGQVALDRGVVLRAAHDQQDQLDLVGGQALSGTQQQA